MARVATASLNTEVAGQLATALGFSGISEQVVKIQLDTD